MIYLLPNISYVAETAKSAAVILDGAAIVHSCSQVTSVPCIVYQLHHAARVDIGCDQEITD